jgi:hypothetical protein
MIACWHPCGIVYESYMLRCRDSTGRHRERLYRTRTGRAESEQNCSHGELTTAEAMRCGSPRSKPNARETTAHTASAEVGAGQAGRRCVSGNGWPPRPEAQERRLYQPLARTDDGLGRPRCAAWRFDLARIQLGSHGTGRPVCQMGAISTCSLLRGPHPSRS